MASSSDIAVVRRNINETTEETWTDQVLATYIDSFGIAGASAKVWEQKAAEAAELVNVTEAGASHQYSDLLKHAMEMVDYWAAQQDLIDNPPPEAAVSGRVHVRVIERL